MADRIPSRREPRPKAIARRGPTEAKQRELDLFLQRAAWRRLSRAYRREHPFCEACREAGRFTPADQVHHKIDRADREDLAYDWDNLQSLCRSCHSRITAERQAADRRPPERPTA